MGYESKPVSGYSRRQISRLVKPGSERRALIKRYCGPRSDLKRFRKRRNELSNPPKYNDSCNDGQGKRLNHIYGNPAKQPFRE